MERTFKEKSKVKVEVQIIGIDESVEKIKELVEKMQEARTLAGELTSCLEKLISSFKLISSPHFGQMLLPGRVFMLAWHLGHSTSYFDFIA